MVEAHAVHAVAGFWVQRKLVKEVVVLAQLAVSYDVSGSLRIGSHARLHAEDVMSTVDRLTDLVREWNQAPLQQAKIRHYLPAIA